MGYSPPGSFVHGTLQARILEWVQEIFTKQQSTQDSHIEGRFFTIWATKEDQEGPLFNYMMVKRSEKDAEVWS